MTFRLRIQQLNTVSRYHMKLLMMSYDKVKPKAVEFGVG